MWDFRGEVEIKRLVCKIKFISKNYEFLDLSHCLLKNLLSLEIDLVSKLTHYSVECLEEATVFILYYTLYSQPLLAFTVQFVLQTQ